MKILIIGAGNPPSPFIDRQIQSLQEKDIKVSLLPSFTKHKYLNKILLKLGLTFHLPERIKSAVRQADILHYQWPGHWMAFGNLAKKYHKPSVLSLRGRQINILPYVPGQENYRRKLPTVLSECDAYHCVSQAILDEAKTLGFKENKPVKIIRPAVNTGFFKPGENEIPEYPLKIVMIGALIWRKGYDFALLGIKKVKEQGLDVTLNIIGEGKDRDHLRYMLHELGIENEVNLLGSKKTTEVMQYLQGSHVLLHTSLSEGIANVIMEAMACGLTVITTSAGGIDEVIEDGENGLLIPSRDPDAVALHIADVYGNSQLRSKLGKKAREDAINKHTLTQQADAFINIYSQVLNQRY